MKIRISEQVASFVTRLAPGPRRDIRLAMRSLAKDEGDVKALEGPLSGYWRLRVSSYRVILSYKSPRTIECIYAEHRSVVYDVFADTLRAKLLSLVETDPKKRR
jgi:mRNA-degrading endonuclease RelE of RelBE toxin-antitoxin system